MTDESPWGYKPLFGTVVDVTIDTATLPLDSAEFERAWMAGFNGEPLPVDASVVFRDAHEVGAGRAVENSEWELARLKEQLGALRDPKGEHDGR